MSVTGVAIAGGAVVSSLISSDAASGGEKSRNKATAAELAFQREQYNRWVDIYGDVEENVGDFYEALTPEYITSQGLEQQQKEHQRATTRIKEQFAQSDITSGAEADILARSELGAARDRAKIRSDAPLKAIEQKQSFIALGKGTPTGYGESLREATRTAGQFEQRRGEQWASTAQTLGDVAGQYYARQERPQPAVTGATPPAIDIPAPFVEGGN